MSSNVQIENYTFPIYQIKISPEVNGINQSNGNHIIGASQSMQILFSELNKLASFPTPVLLRGETGTGKELAAKALHYNGLEQRANFKFIPVNCAGIPEGLLESELFGHVKGSFTNAYFDKVGAAEAANKGTLFLDEIGDMTPGLQAKILRLIHEGEVRRVGSNEVKKVDIRIVAATNIDLEKAIQEGKFRKDLFYRLSVYPVSIPPLNQRKEDIPHLVKHFIDKFNSQYHLRGMNIEITGVDDSATEKLLSRGSWPGNIRELENVIQRAIISRLHGQLEADDIWFDGDTPNSHRSFVPYVPMPEHASQSQGLTIPFQQTEKSKWYEGGVIPITFQNLARMKGAKTRPELINMVSQSEIYALSFPQQEGQRRVVLVANAQNLPLLFQDDAREEIVPHLLEKLNNNPFNVNIRKPFLIVDNFWLLNHASTYKDRDFLEKVMGQAELFNINANGDLPFYVLDHSLAEKIARKPNNPQDALKLLQLKSDVDQEYKRFVHWGDKSKIYSPPLI